MKKLPLILAQAAAVGALAISAIGVTAGTASAYDRRIVRCDRDGDFCVILRCDYGRCVRVGQFHRDRGALGMREYGYAPAYRPRY